MAKKHGRDIEKTCSTSQLAAKLRRLADALEHSKRFRIQIAGQRVCVPARIEHECEGHKGQIEFQIKWTNR